MRHLNVEVLENMEPKWYPHKSPKLKPTRPLGGNCNSVCTDAKYIYNKPKHIKANKTRQRISWFFENEVIYCENVMIVTNGK